MNPALAILLAALNGFCAVAMGAFAAHGLKTRLDDYHLGVINTAAHYQLAHALALLLAGLLMIHWPAAALRWAAWGWFVGMLIFSGSLYVLGMTGIKWLGAITPVGGLGLLLGWGLVAWAAWRQLQA
ncbi:hypothetical protein WH50_00870 [Pokkaliibacter plantistimulans]|uniref:DUF423 domain-containing protein n=1 Tax=Pokkaliibacter plantistimulans TaxID=1635171 RepID=A0ABX5M879_9GAMM|nr:DUF423 domain-containing protein [Pokkaliibacter plantistimulans]PXF33105.1 hypothetical protein WH50_00870 [Pokkaliibacter plantistimulans]